MKFFKKYDLSKQRTVPIGHDLWITAADLIHIANSLPTRSHSKGYRMAARTYCAVLGGKLSDFSRRFEFIEYQGHTLLASWEGKDAWLPTVSLFTSAQFHELIANYDSDLRWLKTSELRAA